MTYAPTVFLTRPVSVVILAIAALMIVWPFLKSWRARRFRNRSA